MSEEKDLDQIESGNNEGFGGLEDFVELEDLQNLEGLGDLSGLGDISDLGDLSDLPGVVPDTLDDLDAIGDIPIPAMEGQEDGELLKEAETAPEAVQDITEGTEEETGILPEEAEETAMPEEMEAADAEETGVQEEPGVLETVQESSGNEETQDVPEEPEVQDLDIKDKTEEPATEEPTLGILEEDTSEDTEGDISLDDITLDDITPVIEEDGLPEEEAAIEQDISLEDILQEESRQEEPATQDGGIDNVLDGLLDNLDINGSIEEEPPAPAAAVEEPAPDDGLDSLLDSLGVPEAVPAMDTVSVEDKEELPQEDTTEDKKPGFLKRVFGNVVTDEIAEAERKAKEEEEEQAVLKAEEEAKAKEEKEAKKAAAAEAKEAKKAEKAAKKAEKAEQKAAKKAEKAAKKEAEKEAEEQEVVGKLNKAGVIIVVAGAAVLLAGVILGTNVFGYNASKSEAERYFTLQRYTDAYNEARGTKLEEKDPELYDKIVTVMKVQQSLDTYSSYAIMKYYPDALNALLRGLQKYDDNIDMAMDLEIEGDMKVCRNRILSILKEEFGLSEQKAYEILSLDAGAYTKRVVGIAKKKI